MQESWLHYENIRFWTIEHEKQISFQIQNQRIRRFNKVSLNSPSNQGFSVSFLSYFNNLFLFLIMSSHSLLNTHLLEIGSLTVSALTFSEMFPVQFLIKVKKSLISCVIGEKTRQNWDVACIFLYPIWFIKLAKEHRFSLFSDMNFWTSVGSL